MNIFLAASVGIYVLVFIIVISAGLDNIPSNSPEKIVYEIVGEAIFWPLYVIKHLVIAIAHGLKCLFT